MRPPSVAELIGLHGHPTKPSFTRFASVRFWERSGCNGSVVPLFQAQIAAGGPVTVTHPEMRRYFMSVPEAVGLVLQASTMCKDSDIFVLDMGEPVRIMDLATNLIGLAGRVPNQDIDIRITGLRPGEKLFEELRLDGEDIAPTYHEKIKIFTGACLVRSKLEHWDSTASWSRRASTTTLNHLRGTKPEYSPRTHRGPPGTVRDRRYHGDPVSRNNSPGCPRAATQITSTSIVQPLST
jgi:FlaA1/EpsC-like NDP-sugar epimerase